MLALSGPHIVSMLPISAQSQDTELRVVQVGRAGRFGTKGLAITFVASEDDSKVHTAWLLLHVGLDCAANLSQVHKGQAACSVFLPSCCWLIRQLSWDGSSLRPGS